MEAPEKKARELIEKFKNFASGENESDIELQNAVHISKIACDEILEIIRYHGTDIGKHSLMFWREVKQHLNKMQ